jgi:hypothetical protein
VVLVCRTDDATLRHRLEARAREQTASDARLEIWPALRAAYTEPAELPDAVIVDATRSIADLVEQALATLRG